MCPICAGHQCAQCHARVAIKGDLVRHVIEQLSVLISTARWLIGRSCESYQCICPYTPHCAQTCCCTNAFAVCVCCTVVRRWHSANCFMMIHCVCTGRQNIHRWEAMLAFNGLNIYWKLLIIVKRNLNAVVYLSNLNVLNGGSGLSVRLCGFFAEFFLVFHECFSWICTFEL